MVSVSFVSSPFAAISREDSEESHHNNHNSSHHLHHHHRSGHTNGSGVVGGNKGQYNGFTSDEYLDRLEPSNGNVEKSDKRYAKRKFLHFMFAEFTVRCKGLGVESEDVRLEENIYM